MLIIHLLGSCFVFLYVLFCFFCKYLIKQNKVYREVTRKKQLSLTYVCDGCFIHQKALHNVHYFHLIDLLSNFSVSIDVDAKHFFCVLHHGAHIIIWIKDKKVIQARNSKWLWTLTVWLPMKFLTPSTFITVETACKVVYKESMTRERKRIEPNSK